MSCILCKAEANFWTLEEVYDVCAIDKWGVCPLKGMALFCNDCGSYFEKDTLRKVEAALEKLK